MSACRVGLRGLLLVLGLCGALNSAPAQSRAPAAVEFVPGGELENYLRMLQVAGVVGWHPWSIRAFSARELEKLLPSDTASVPWALSPAAMRSRVTLGPIGVGAIANSGFPYGFNDGPTWAGRGLTATASGSVAGRIGPLTLTLAPGAFISTNGSFPLLDNGMAGTLAYNDGLYPMNVDRPQRFGDGAHGRGDPGASEVRVDTRFVTLGFGTAPMMWGPAAEYPYLMGTNAPGFPHAFLGTGEPVNVGIGRLHTRAYWGKLFQSSYSPVVGSDRFVVGDETGRTRLMAGMVLLFTPRIAPHLELGFGRFVHVPYPESGIDGRFFRKPWPRFLKKNVYGPEATREVDLENELASVFARWAFPSAGFELYAEHGQDDWFHDLRDLTQEPDHQRTYMLGFQKVLRVSRSGASAIRGELINYQVPPLGRDRPGEGFIYAHNILRQGHTNRGQLIGSGPGVGSAAGSVLAWDRYAPVGRTTLSWRRIVRAHTGSFESDGITVEKAVDVIHSLGAERSRGSGSFRYTTGLDVMVNFNRNFARDAFNLNARVGVEWSPGRGSGRP
jgi:hypothetical protein